VRSKVDCTIREVVETVTKVVNYKGKIEWDASKPDGTPRKLMDVSRLKRLGWESQINLREGLEKTYKWFLTHQDDYRK